MGRAILAALHQEEDIILGAALEEKGNLAVRQKQNVGQLMGIDKWNNIPVSANIKNGVLNGEAIIDFTHPTATLAILKEAVSQKKSMVIGTTGFSKEEKEEITAASKKIPIVLSPNMSVGVNVLFKLLADAAYVLGDAYDAEIVEMHHQHKKDAPSGTALRMGESIARARGTTLQKVGRFTRNGFIGERPTGEIGISSLRGGDVVGDHTALFSGPGERIEITHRAHSRDNFARGALIAARWVIDQPPGLYDMMDVLDLKMLDLKKGTNPVF